jgi:hypothetical protein
LRCQFGGLLENWLRSITQVDWDKQRFHGLGSVNLIRAYQYSIPVVKKILLQEVAALFEAVFISFPRRLRRSRRQR